MNKVYGYWVSKDEIIEVPQWGHDEIAYSILENEYNISIEELQNGLISAYDMMFYLGYVRVVNEGYASHKAQHWEGAKHSKLQKGFLKEADFVDTWGYEDEELEALQELLERLGVTL